MLLPPPRFAVFGGGARRPLYAASDAPQLLRSACARACFSPRTWVDFLPALRPLAPRPELLGSCAPYWVAAVDKEVLMRSRRVVYSDTSNFGRAVAVARRRTLGAEPLRFLYSLAVTPPLPPNASVAALELAFFGAIGEHSGEGFGHAHSASLAPWAHATADADVQAALGARELAHDPERDSSCEGLAEGGGDELRCADV